jgi:hypothetical protein
MNVVRTATYSKNGSRMPGGTMLQRDSVSNHDGFSLEIGAVALSKVFINYNILLRLSLTLILIIRISLVRHKASCRFVGQITNLSRAWRTG